MQLHMETLTAIPAGQLRVFLAPDPFPEWQ